MISFKLEFYDANGILKSSAISSVTLTATPTSVFDVVNSNSSGAITLALSMDNQSANQVLASPSSGGAAAPAFRALVDDDIPTTLAGKTLTTPTIASFANANHDHTNSAGGGQLNASSVFSAGQIPLARGGTNADLSATGGAFQILKQVGSGSAITVGLPGIATLVSRASLGTSSSFTISSIPQNFITLLLILELRSALSAVSDTGRLQFGGGSLDTTAANYTTYTVRHVNTTPTQVAAENIGGTAYHNFDVTGASAPSNYVGYALIYIHNYSVSSALKYIINENMYNAANTTGNLVQGKATTIWLNTSNAVQQIAVSCAGGNIASPSFYTLLGLGTP